MAASSSRGLRTFLLRYKPNPSHWKITAVHSYATNAVASRHFHQGSVHPSAIVHPEAVIGQVKKMRKTYQKIFMTSDTINVNFEDWFSQVVNNLRSRHVAVHP